VHLCTLPHNFTHIAQFMSVACCCCRWSLASHQPAQPNSNQFPNGLQQHQFCLIFSGIFVHVISIIQKRDNPMFQDFHPVHCTNVKWVNNLNYLLFFCQTHIICISHFPNLIFVSLLLIIVIIAVCFILFIFFLGLPRPLFLAGASVAALFFVAAFFLVVVVVSAPPSPPSPPLPSSDNVLSSSSFQSMDCLYLLWLCSNPPLFHSLPSVSCLFDIM
jgi:hypothetical protein